ncbi:hypothetical protein UFOVP286_17 [uncultured Caudovirales phage]|uniref:Uncharacterized protein n=1 Tax=uncultured Caudovirales phage TaxID=2100421 RepID=A0A6J5LVH0_9CAUD|nr:hypothetical protein UFOVP286_17 [uncultured Caudovirales phage]
MYKLFSKINCLDDSYYFEQAQERDEDIKTIKIGEDFRDVLIDYISDNSIDISDVSDDEFDACVELLQNWANISENKSITFSISN